MKKSQKKEEYLLVKDYKALFAHSEASQPKKHEWEKRGDEFEKFSLFKDYPPAMTSDGTFYIRNNTDQDA